jgi:hypothetical protein
VRQFTQNAAWSSWLFILHRADVPPFHPYSRRVDFPGKFGSSVTHAPSPKPQVLRDKPNADIPSVPVPSPKRRPVIVVISDSQVVPPGDPEAYIRRVPVQVDGNTPSGARRRTP